MKFDKVMLLHFLNMFSRETSGEMLPNIHFLGSCPVPQTKVSLQGLWELLQNLNTILSIAKQAVGPPQGPRFLSDRVRACLFCNYLIWVWNFSGGLFRPVEKEFRRIIIGRILPAPYLQAWGIRFYGWEIYFPVVKPPASRSNCKQASIRFTPKMKNWWCT